MSILAVPFLFSLFSLSFCLSVSVLSEPVLEMGGMVGLFNERVLAENRGFFLF
jgi:hypothetical protein